MMRKSSVERRYELEREKEKERRRIAWMIQQEKEREHERLKQKKIEEYEKKRAEMLALKEREHEKIKEKKYEDYLKKRTDVHRKPRSPSRSDSESRSRSRSEESHRRSQIKHRTSRSQIMSEKLDLSEGNKPFFNGPTEAPTMDENELRKVSVTIVRKIPVHATATSEIQRDIVNHEEITLIRRDEMKYRSKDGQNIVLREGKKPIFDREELKLSEVKATEVQESRTVSAVDANILPKRLKRRSKSLSPRRYRSPSPRASSSSRSFTYRSRHDEYSRHHSKDRHYKDDKIDRHYFDSKKNSRDELRRHRSTRARSYSRERDYYRDERDYSRTRNDKERREYRSRSKERSYDRRDRRDFSEERRLPPPHYFEQMPYPLYYSAGFGPRPMLVGPSIPIPLSRPMGRGHPSMRPILPPYPPRFVPPQDVYRPLLSPNEPRFRRIH